MYMLESLMNQEPEEGPAWLMGGGERVEGLQTGCQGQTYIVRLDLNPVHGKPLMGFTQESNMI